MKQQPHQRAVDCDGGRADDRRPHEAATTRGQQQWIQRAEDAQRFRGEVGQPVSGTHVVGDREVRDRVRGQQRILPSRDDDECRRQQWCDQERPPRQLPVRFGDDCWNGRSFWHMPIMVPGVPSAPLSPALRDHAARGEGFHATRRGRRALRRRRRRRTGRRGPDGRDRVVLRSLDGVAGCRGTCVRHGAVRRRSPPRQRGEPGGLGTP